MNQIAVEMKGIMHIAWEQYKGSGCCSRAHGADLSGQIGGEAGGIGGLLSSTRGAEAVFYHYDFNGNIVQISSSNQVPLASYTYSPFGEVLLKEGPFDSRYQFSTKEYDEPTAMNYYGYRFYNPELGRWINRDPLGERGGLNLYGFARNNALKYIDRKGHQAQSTSSSLPIVWGCHGTVCRICTATCPSNDWTCKNKCGFGYGFGQSEAAARENTHSNANSNLPECDAGCSGNEITSYLTCFPIDDPDDI